MNRQTAILFSFLLTVGGAGFRHLPDPALYFLLLAFGVTAITLILVFPNRELYRAGIKKVLGLQGVVIGLCHLSNPLLVILLWLLAPLILENRIRGRFEFKNRGAFFYYQSLSSLLFALAWLPKTGSFEATLLFGLSAWIRLGAFPFQASALDVVQRDMSTSTLFLGSQMGFIPLIRWFLPFVEVHPTGVFKLFVVLSLVGILYFASLAVVEVNLKRLAVLVSLTGSSFALLGLIANHDKAASLQIYSVVLFTSALLSVVWLVSHRVGNHWGGLAKSLPTFATFFLLFGLCAGGFPGSLGFISEDLILEDLFKFDFLYGATFLVGLGLLAIALYRSFIHVFLGPVAFEAQGIGILRRERFGLLLLLAALVIPFFCSGPFLNY